MATETIYLLTRHKGTETEILGFCRDEYYDDLIPVILDCLEEDYLPEPNYRFITKVMLPCDDEYWGSKRKDKRSINEKGLYKYLMNYFAKNDIYRVSSDLAYEVTIHSVPIPKKNWDGTYGRFSNNYGNSYGRNYGLGTGYQSRTKESYGNDRHLGYNVVDDDEENWWV